MKLRDTNSGSVKVRDTNTGGVVADIALTDDFTIIKTPRDKIIVEGTDEQRIEQDAWIKDQTGATVDREYDFAGGEEFTSLDTGIATISDSGRVTRVSDGDARINIRNDNLTKRAIAEVSREDPGEAVSLVRYFGDDSLAAVCSKIIDDKIETGTVGDLLPMYDDLAARTRNGDAWPGIDTSCIDAEKPNATLIGQQYAIQANHYKDSEDVFVAMDGTVETRTVNGRVNVAGDVDVVKYDSALPAKFIPALLPPTDFKDYFGQLKWGVPVLASDQQKKARVFDLWKFDSLVTFVHESLDSRRAEFYEETIGGDSGSGVFLILPSDRLLLIMAFTSSGAGPDYSEYVAGIISAVETLGGSESDLEFADLSAYPKFNWTCQIGFDGDATDRLGNHDGSETGSPTYVPGRLGSHAIQTDASNYVTIADHDDYDVGAEDSFFASIWLRQSSLGHPSTDLTLLKGVSPNNGDPQWGLRDAAGGGFLAARVEDSANNEIQANFTSAAMDGEFHHLVFGLNRETDRFIGWIDGAQVFDEDASSIGDLSNGVDITLGKNAQGQTLDGFVFGKTAPMQALVDYLGSMAPTNLLAASEDFTDAAWPAVRVTPTANNATAPDGTMTADTLATTTGDVQYMYQAVTVEPSTTYVFSAWYRSDTLASVRLAVYDVDNASFLVSDSDHDISATWTHVYVSFTTAANQTTARVYPWRHNSGTVDDSFECWGAMLQAGDYPLGYQPKT